MRGTKAKALRRQVYGSTDSVFCDYRNGEKRTCKSTMFWGWPFRIYTRIADPKRRAYQRLKAA